ncbi:aldehyde dehydrogenase family protein [Mesoterricola sediminis]|uniref:Aldehyde dehydrogenase n=1 Tax=Mesoterricola sediminis TaxID=2927980 RepID=A0AA48H2Q9_9BACT|nr:aldehyde dehydrogenase family protein [Mesoterricola sediminis]BDU76396.1 aldehyde dehydrogenase [Mesoterricola sediminis]
MHLKENAPSVASHGRTVIGFNWIGGREVEGDLPSFDSRSPIDTRDTVGIFPECGERDVEKAARAAAAAFPAWSATPAPLRGALVGRIGEGLARHKDKLAAIITREVGKPPREAQAEVQEAIDLCAYYQGEGRRLHGQTIPSELPDRAITTYRRPLGVVAVMAGGAFPLSTPAARVIPAILCGNTVVWKASEDAPTTAYLLARCMMDAGLPPGVVNILNGKGRTGCGKHVVAGLDKGFYQKFCFSGATAVGKLVAEAAGRNLLVPSLELSGKNPLLVMPGCDLEAAVQGALWGAFGTAGQRRTSVGNILVHQDLYPAFREAFLAATDALPIGNPITHPEVFFGPMLNARFTKAFEAHWAMGQEDGAALVRGGARITEDNRTARVLGPVVKGHFVEPCVWEGVTPEMKLFQTEILGPTVNLCRVEDLDQALAWANATPYGFSAALYAEDRRTIERFKREVRAGLVFINASTSGTEAHVPYGGAGWSGNGSREAGAWALESYTRWQAVMDDTSGSHRVAQLDTAHHLRHTYDPSHWDKL